MTSRPRRLLMVALRYPPHPGVGTIRTLKFQKYLPEHGWIADVLTGGGVSGRPSIEPAPASRGQVYRLPYPQPVARLLGGPPPGPLARTLLAVHTRLLVPDEHAHAVLAIRRAAGWLAGQGPFDALYATGMPWSGHLGAVALRSRLHLPLVLDFRDPWVEEIGVRHGALRTAVEAMLERIAVRAADRILVTADGLKDDLLRRHTGLTPARVEVIPNGYDEEDFGADALPLHGGLFRILHAGRFYGSKGPLPLLRGLRLWLDRRPELRDTVRLVLLGQPRRADAELARRMALEPVVEFPGALPHRQAVAAMTEADLLVAIDYDPPQSGLRVVSKMFEYLRSGRPILFLGSGGGTERLLSSMDGCDVVPKGEPAAVATALDRIHAARPVPPRDRGPALRPFDRRALAGRLAEVLDGLAAG